jgi:hypothetical protein
MPKSKNADSTGREFTPRQLNVEHLILSHELIFPQERFFDTDLESACLRIAGRVLSVIPRRAAEGGLTIREACDPQMPNTNCEIHAAMPHAGQICAREALFTTAASPTSPRAAIDGRRQSRSKESNDG